MNSFKIVLYFLTTIIVSQSIYAQNITTANHNEEMNYILSTNINEAENKEKLLEKLEEIKIGLDEKTRELHELEWNKKRITHYKEALKEISYDILKKSFREINKEMRNDHSSLVLLEESRLRNRLQDFFSLFNVIDTIYFSNTGINTRLNFYEPFYELLYTIKIQEPLAGFLNGEPKQPFFTDSTQVEALKLVLSEGQVHDIHFTLKEAMLKEINYITLKEFDLEKEINLLKSSKRKIQDKIANETDIDLFSILLGLPLFCMTIIFLFMGPGFIQSKYGNGIINPLLEKSQSILLDLSTVLLLTMSVLILGLSGSINGDVLGTLIGGISGYVLNKTKT